MTEIKVKVMGKLIDKTQIQNEIMYREETQKQFNNRKKNDDMKNERICCDCEYIIMQAKYIRCEQCILIKQLRLPSSFFDKETGLKLVIQERLKVKQSKHNESHDLWVNGDRQMAKVAKKLLYTHKGGPNWCNLINPFNWHKTTWRKMIHSTYKRRLVIAGQLICAELDRIITKGEV